jgi:putative membrane protein insertion efficiency factor
MITSHAGVRWSGRLVALPVRLYRALLSPWLPAACRFHPSCSAYAVQALEVHGPLGGLLLAARRVARCHPFHPGGLDPVPLPPGPAPEENR